MLTFKEWIAQLKTTERAELAVYVSQDSKLLYDTIINEFTAVEKYADERPLSASGLWMYIRANWSLSCREAGGTPNDEYGRKAQVRFLDLDKRFADFNHALEAKGMQKKVESPMQATSVYNFEQNFGKWCNWRYQIAGEHAFDDAIKAAQWVHTQTNGHPVFTPIIEQAMRSAIVLVLPTDTWSMFAARWLSLCNDLWAVQGCPRNVPQLHADKLRNICSALYLQDLPLMEKQAIMTEKQANTNKGEVMSDTKSHVPSMSDLKSDASQAAYIVVAGKLTKLSAQSLGSLLQRELPNESPETRARIGAFLESSMGELVTSLMLSALVGPLGGTIADKLGVSSAQLDKLSSALRVHAMVSGGSELLNTLIGPAIVVLKDVLRALPSEDGPRNMHLLPEPAKRETLETVAVPDTAKVSK